MDPQPQPNREHARLDRSRSIADNFLNMPAIISSYAEEGNSFFENTLQNFENSSTSAEQNEFTGENQNFDENGTPGQERQREQFGQRNIRAGLEQFRISLDATREGQTFVNIVKNVFPFLLLFASKFLIDHIYELLFFILLYGVFFLADFYVQRCVSGGFPTKIFQIAYCFGFSSLTFLYLQAYSLEDFEFSTTFNLNIMYFVSGEFKELSMSSTLYGVVVIDTSFKLLTVIPKSMLIIVPDSKLPSSVKRKLLQVIEYCSELYRCALPFGPWIRYFLFVTPGSSIVIYFFCIVYVSLKVSEMYRYSMFVKKSVRCLVSNSSLGSSAKAHEYDDEVCTVCHGDFTQPIKLECKHVFCKVCIETWLDQKTTCPMCRAEVAKDVDNEWKNGGTSLALRMF